MREFDYYATDEESLAILTDIVLTCGFRVIPDCEPYDKPAARIFDTVDDELKRIALERGLFLMGSFSRHPPGFVRQQTGPAAGKYYLSPSEGGPLIQMLPARLRDVEGKPTLLSGFVMHQRYYRNPETGEYEPSSQELRDAFKSIVKVMKQRLTTHKLAMKIWIGREALRLLEQGKVQITDIGVIGAGG